MFLFAFSGDKDHIYSIISHNIFIYDAFWKSKLTHDSTIE